MWRMVYNKLYNITILYNYNNRWLADRHGLNVTKLHCYNVTIQCKARSILRGAKITASTGEEYCSHQLSIFDIKIAIKREQSHARMSSAEHSPIAC